MSTRSLDVQALTLGEESVEIIVFAFLDFVGDPCFWHSSVGYITWGGEDWLGLGSFGRVDPIPETMGTAPARLRLTLFPPQGALLDEAINQNTWGRLCELYLGVVKDSNLVRDPVLLLRGTMGPASVALGPNGSVAVSVEDVRAKLDRINGMRATQQDHQTDVNAIDAFYDMLPAMQDFKFVFNGTVRAAPSVVSPTGGRGGDNSRSGVPQPSPGTTAPGRTVGGRGGTVYPPYHKPGTTTGPGG